MNRQTRSRSLTGARSNHSAPHAQHPQAKRPARASDWLTVEQVCDELQVSRRTFDRWRARRTGPRCVRLGGNGPVRTKRCWLEDWINESGHGTA